MKNDQKQHKVVIEDFPDEVISFFKSLSGVDDSTAKESTPPASTTPESTSLDSTTKEPTTPETTVVDVTPKDTGTTESTPPKTTPPEDTSSINPTVAETIEQESTPPETKVAQEITPPESREAQESTSPDSTEQDILVPKSNVLELFQQVKDYVFRTDEIGTTSKLIMLYLFDRSLVSNYISEISYTSIANAIGVSETTAIKNTKELEDAGLIRYIRGVNHKAPSKVDIRPLIEKVAMENELYIRVTDIISDWWNEIYSTRNCRGSALVMYGLYVLEYKNKQYKQSGRSPSDSTSIDTGVPDSTSIDSTGVDSTPPKTNGVGFRLRYSVYSTLEKILKYSLARGFDKKNINRHFFEWFYNNTNIKGSYAEKQKILEKLEMDILIAVEYTLAKNAKNKWNYTLSCLKNDFTAKEDTPDLRNKIKENIEIMQSYFNTPEKIFIDGAVELRQIMQILGQNEEINPSTVNHTREKLKRIIERLNASVEETIRNFNITSGKATDELFNIH